MENQNKTKKVYIEALRIIACYFVIFNHSDNAGFFLFSFYPDTSFTYWFYLFITVFCKFSVPLFFAISGALLIPKQEDFKVLFKKRIVRIVVDLLLVSLMYYVRFNYPNISIKEFLLQIYSSYTTISLWYLYVFIAFLLGLPLIRKLATNMSNQEYLYMVIIGVIFNGFIPCFEYLLFKGEYSLNGFLNISWLASNVVLYPCLGYYLEERLDIKRVNKKNLTTLWLVNIAFILFTCFMTFYRARITGICELSQSQTYFNMFVVSNVIAMYVTFKYFYYKHPYNKTTEKLVLIGGSCTFGIYLIHILIQGLLQHFSVFDRLLNLGINQMLACLMVNFANLLISFVIIYLLKKIKLVNKYI